MSEGEQVLKLLAAPAREHEHCPPVSYRRRPGNHLSGLIFDDQIDNLAHGPISAGRLRHIIDSFFYIR